MEALNQKGPFIRNCLLFYSELNPLLLCLKWRTKSLNEYIPRNNYQKLQISNPQNASFSIQSNEIPFFARFVIVLRIELIRPFDKNIIKQMMPRCHAKSWFILYKKRYYNWIEKRQQKHISFMKRPINWFIQMQLIRNDMIFYLYSILKCLSCKCFKSAVHYKFLLSRTILYV